MNQRDRDNLEFLLNASPEVIEDWYNQMDDDDIEYAFELLEQLKEELDREIIVNEFSSTGVVLKDSIIVAPLNFTVH